MAFLLVQTLLCFYLLIVTSINLRYLRNLPRRRLSPDRLPLVSVCVPARNEEAVIETCLRSLLAQDYPRFEIVVVDDCSEDATAEIVRRLADEAPPGRVRLIEGETLPAGWIGKSWACEQAGRAARGDWLFFTDADTRFAPDALRYSIEAAEAKEADLLTGMPRMEFETIWEKLSVPMLCSAFMQSAPLWIVEDQRFPRLAGGSGATLFFRREAWETIGGHGSVKNQIVEDMLITRAVKRAGLRLGIADFSDRVSCRMYRSFAEVWEGFSKNSFAVYELNFWLMLPVLAFVWTVFLLPWAWYFAGPLWGWSDAAGTDLPMIQIALVTASRCIHDWKCGRLDFWAVLLTPLAVVFFTVLTLRAWTRHLLGQTTRWRGREYRLE